MKNNKTTTLALFARKCLVGYLVMGFVFSAGAASTRYWTGAAEDGMFFNPTNWSTKTSKLTWADTLHFTNDVPIVLSTKSFGAFDSQWPRFVYLHGSDVIVKDGLFRLHGANVTPAAFIDIAEGSKFVLTNSTDHSSGSQLAFNNYNGGEIVKKGKGLLEVWGRGGNTGCEMSQLAGAPLRVEAGEVALRTTSSCGGYLTASEVIVDEGATLTLAGGYNSSYTNAPWTINGTLRLYAAGGETACGSLNGTGVITNVPWSSTTSCLTIFGSDNKSSAFEGTIPSPKVGLMLFQAGTASDGYFRIVRPDMLKDCAGLSLKNTGNPISFPAGIGTVNISSLGVNTKTTTATLTLTDLNGDAVTVNTAMSGTDLERLYTAGKGGLVISGEENSTLLGSKLKHEGILSVSRNLTLGDGTSAANDFDFAQAPRRIELRGTKTLTVNNVEAFSYTGTLANENGGVWSFNTPGTLARVEKRDELRMSADLTINGGFLKNCYAMTIGDGKTLTLSNVTASYDSSSGLNFRDTVGSRLVFNGKVFDISAYEKCAPMYFEQRGGEVRFVGSRLYTPPSSATTENPATYLFDGGLTRVFGSSPTPFSSTALNLLAGASGAKLRDDESSISLTACIYIKAPFKSGVAAPTADGGVEIDARHWFRFLYPLEITGPFKLIGSGAMVEASASFTDNTPFFGAGDIALDTSEIAFYPRTGSKTVNLATGTGCKLSVKGSSLLSARYRDPNSTNTKDPNHFVIRTPEFGDAGMLAFIDRVASVGSSGASTVKLESGVPQMSASGRVLAPIVMGGKVAKFTTYDATDGFKDFTGGVTSVGDCTASTVLCCDGAKEFPAKQTCAVEAIYCKDWSLITVPSTTTLTIGDGTNPGMLLMAGQRGITGGGTLDFRGAKAMFVGGGSGSADYSGECNVKITNASSVNYLSTLDEQSSHRRISLSTAQDYACETYVSGVRLLAKNASCFSTGRVHVMGGMRKGGQIDFRTAGTWANDFTVRGAGLSNTEWDSSSSSFGTAALNFYANATVSGDVTVNEFARISAQTDVTGTFSGVISGGRIYFYRLSGEIVLAGHNTYTGGTFVDGGTLTLKCADSAGTGVVELSSASGTATLNFDNDAAITFANEVLGSGEIRVSGKGAVTFTGEWAAALPFRRLGAGTVLTLNNGAVVLASSSVVPAFNGDVDLGGGTYSVAGVSGTGVISHGTLNVTGVVSPGGEGAIGTLHFGEGVFVPAGAITYLCEIGPNETSDIIEIEGDFSATSDSITVRTLDGGKPEKASWTILTATGTLSLPFASSAFPQHAMYVEGDGNSAVLVNPQFGTVIIVK